MSVHEIHRRTFLKASSLLSAGLVMPGHFPAISRKNENMPLSISIFSKHLQFLPVNDMAEAVAEMGFDGVDLSVRPNGHVEPAQVDEKLPLAVEAMKKSGLKPLMMTCSVADAANATDLKVLETAARSGFRFYRMTYFHYQKDKTIPESIEFYRDRVRDLAVLNENLGITGCYQNHAGNYIGASIWELFDLVNSTQNKHFGIQYDIRHAVVEGGLSWQNGLRLVKDRIATLALKDFRWEKSGGKWKLINCPIGEGMVDFISFFRLIKEYKLNVPVSLHYEYPLGGAERGDKSIQLDKRAVFEAMRRDLLKVRELWEKAI